jgi:NTP pyrophosphatase (non-canonical NTP hydrolase)
MDLSEYQRQALLTDQAPSEPDSHVLVPLLGLAGEVGELLSEYKKRLRDGEAHSLFPSRIKEELGDILWYVAAVAARFHFDLEEVATSNLEKCNANWARNRLPSSVFRRFDGEYPDAEQFPAKFTIHLEEVVEGDVTRVRASWAGKQMGQTLTDNAYDDDGYRFHDVFHLACVASLGWSPVSRRNLDLKRRSNAQVDEVEDGGRATVIEEGITALVFGYALEHNWLEGVDRVDHDVLKMVKRMTAHLEVAECSIAEWETTILMAFPVWRAVIRNRGGAVGLDLTTRTLRFVG